MDCHTREILGWRLTRSGNAKAAEATLEDALIGRFGSLARLAQPLILRSDNGLVFTSKRFTVTVATLRPGAGVHSAPHATAERDD